MVNLPTGPTCRLLQIAGLSSNQNDVVYIVGDEQLMQFHHLEIFHKDEMFWFTAHYVWINKSGSLFSNEITPGAASFWLTGEEQDVTTFKYVDNQIEVNTVGLCFYFWGQYKNFFAQVDLQLNKIHQIKQPQLWNYNNWTCFVDWISMATISLYELKRWYYIYCLYYKVMSPPYQFWSVQCLREVSRRTGLSN